MDRTLGTTQGFSGPPGRSEGLVFWHHAASTSISAFSSSNSRVEKNESAAALSNAEPTRPLDLVMPSAPQAVANASLVYRLPRAEWKITTGPQETPRLSLRRARAGRANRHNYSHRATRREQVA